MSEFVTMIPAVLVLDIALLALSAAATAIVVWYWVRIRHSGAALGVALILIGAWVHVLLHVFDFTEAPSLPSQGDSAREVQTPGEFLAWLINNGIVVFILGGLLALVRNVLLQFQTQSRLLAEAEQREKRLRDAANLAKLGFYIYDTATDRVVYCTEQHAASHGMSVTEYLLKASTIGNDMPLIHPDDREMVRAKYMESRAGKTVELEYRVPTKQGERRVREITTPVFDENGKVIREVGTSQDVTEQREVEARLQQSIKVEAIGNLTGGVAHDFNNLLAVILGNLELAREDPEHVPEFLDQAISAALKGADLTKSMLSFARRAPLEPSELDLNKIVLDTKNWAARTLPSVIEVETSLLAGLWRISADRSATESALLNLILNARDAMPAGGRLTIETANVRVDEDYIEERREDIGQGRYVMLAVSDTGEGIVPQNIDRIFDPFFSTKGPGKGSGLGLSMIHGFMKQSGGTVRVYSEPGAGTTFKLYFRAVARSDERPRPKHGASDPQTAGAGRTILVAEDEPAVMEVLVRALRASGYHVITAATGDAALEAFKAADRVDLIVSDIVMPGNLQGPTLVRALREIDPELPAVFISGYANEATVHGNGLRPEDIRLMKPVSRKDMLAAISQALAARG